MIHSPSSFACRLHWVRVKKQLLNASQCCKIRKTLRQITNQLQTALQSSSPISDHPLIHESQPQQRGEQQNVCSVPTKEEIVVLRDQEVISPEFAHCLVPMTVDNDVESGPEEAGRGIGLLYGELLYSLGEEMVARRGKKEKKLKKKGRDRGEDKQNWDCNQRREMQETEKNIFGRKNVVHRMIA